MLNKPMLCNLTDYIYPPLMILYVYLRRIHTTWSDNKAPKAVGAGYDSMPTTTWAGVAYTNYNTKKTQLGAPQNR